LIIQMLVLARSKRRVKPLLSRIFASINSERQAYTIPPVWCRIWRLRFWC